MEPTDTTSAKKTPNSGSEINAISATKPSVSHVVVSPVRPTRPSPSRRVRSSADTTDLSASNSSNPIEGGRKELFPADPPGQKQPNE